MLWLLMNLSTKLKLIVLDLSCVYVKCIIEQNTRGTKNQMHNAAESKVEKHPFEKFTVKSTLVGSVCFLVGILFWQRENGLVLAAYG